MAGRAGRTVSSDSMACGESFLLASDDAPVSKLLELASAPVEPTQSCLREDKRGMKRAMLEAVCLGLVLEPHDVRLYAKSTLLAQLSDKEVYETSHTSHHLRSSSAAGLVTSMLSLTSGCDISNSEGSVLARSGFSSFHCLGQESRGMCLSFCTHCKVSFVHFCIDAHRGYLPGVSAVGAWSGCACEWVWPRGVPSDTQRFAAS